VLKDRLEIQEAAEEEKNYARKMILIKKMMRDCPTIKTNE